MKNKKFIWVLTIITLLIISFFMSGGSEVVPLSPEDMNNDTDVSIDIDLLEEEKENSVDNGTDKEFPDHLKVEDNEVEIDKDKSKDGETENFKKDTIVENLKKEDETKEKTTDKEEISKQKDADAKVLKEKIIVEDNKNKDKKDKYLTDPVPEGKPEPVEWQDTTINKDKKLTATLSVTCKSILNNMDMFNMDKIEVLPEDGIIYATQTVTFNEGESVFDVLLREMQKNKIHMEFVMTPIYNSNYVEGINNLYEFDCGELSGWMYRVNGWFPNYGCSRYLLEDGDVIEWIYTCDLGRDIGGDWAITGGGS